MLASLALVTLLQSPVAGADPALSNPRLTHGALGPARTGTALRPGDSAVLSFDINGLTTDDTGKASYSTAVEVTDAAGKSIFKQPAKKYQEFLPLGGGTMPGIAQVDLGLDAPAGKYTMNVTVTDAANQKSASIKQDVTVVTKGFDLVRLSLSGDADGLVPVGAYVVGQPLWVHAAVIGFNRGKSGQPKVNVQLRVLDSGKKPIVAKPFSGIIDKDVPTTATSLPIRFFVPLNKAGSYTVELTAADETQKNAPATLSFPITVLPNK